MFYAYNNSFQTCILYLCYQMCNEVQACTSLNIWQHIGTIPKNYGKSETSSFVLSPTGTNVMSIINQGEQYSFYGNKNKILSSIFSGNSNPNLFYKKCTKQYQYNISWLIEGDGYESRQTSNIVNKEPTWRLNRV